MYFGHFLFQVLSRVLLSPFKIQTSSLVPIQEGSLGNREELVAAGHSHPPAAQGPLLRSRWGQVGALPDLGGV